MNRQPAGDGRIDSVLGESTKVKGEIHVEGAIRVDGDFTGTIHASETVVVGKTGTLHAEVNSEFVNVGGKVFGNILGRKKVVLEAGAHVEGDVTTSSLVVSEGVFFQGGCRMGDGHREKTGSTPAAGQTATGQSTTSGTQPSRDQKVPVREGATVRTQG